MKKTTKSALLSALVCPGAGHLALDVDRRGWIFLVLTLILLGLLLAPLMQVTTSLVADINNGTLPPDVFQIKALLHERLAVVGGSRITAIGVTLIVVWVIALIDVIRLGRQIDHHADA